MRLDNKVALITGASHGIGEGLAVAFAEAGADVVLAARSVDDLERVSRRVESLGRRALVVPTDVSDLSAIQSMVDIAVGSMGSIDVLANVAGSVRRVPILEASADDWEFTTHVQQRSVYFASQAVARVMIEQGRGGKMLNIASMTSYRGYHGISLYGAAKAAVIQMTKNMAVEWASYDIQVNAIAPGWIETPMTATIAPSRRRWIEERTLQGKFGVVEDLSAMAVLLCSPAGGFITGQTIPIDGGFLAGHPWPTGD
jgi:2-deoxy-D-gluconate 3-dehydrogenase